MNYETWTTTSIDLEMIFIGSLALIGFPFLTGFYSKDTILEVAYAKYTIWGHFSYYLGTFAAFFTAFYSMKYFLSLQEGIIIFSLYVGFLQGKKISISSILYSKYFYC